MAKTPAGVPPDDELILAELCKIPVAELSKIARVAPTYYYAEARRGRAPKPDKGVTLAEAKAWLDGRIAKKAARAAAVRRLRAFYEAPDAAESLRNSTKEGQT
jgi:hypothetical protein